MFSVPGIYDGKNVYPIETIIENKKYKVIITFVEELDPIQVDNFIRDFGADSSAFSFWESKEEDIYQDYLNSSKRK
jgi:hypothetical protein